METTVLIAVFLAAGALMASGIWVGSVLIRTIVRIKRPAITSPGKVPGGATASHPDSARS